MDNGIRDNRCLGFMRSENKLEYTIFNNVDIITHNAC